MNLVSLVRSQAANRFVSLTLVVLILTSCAPVAPYTVASGGPNPPLEEAAPLENPESIAVRGTPTLAPDVESDAASDVEADTQTDADTTPEATTEPTPTLTPTITPEPVIAAEAISMQAALNCLASGQVVYGLALQNTNVRQEPDVAACRIGRIPKGSLVRITGSIDADNPLANISLVTVTPIFTPEPTGDASVAEVENGDADVAPAEDGAAILPQPTSASDRALNAIFPGRENSAPTGEGDSGTIALLPTATLEATPSPTPTATAAATATPTSTPATSEDSTSAAVVTTHFGFEEDIKPLFDRTCNTCHSGIVKSNDLQVTEYEPLMEGGKSGPAVIPGDAETSLLWTQIESGKMPLIGELGDVDKAMVRDWIDAGAPQFRPTAVPTVATTPTATATATAATQIAEADAEGDNSDEESASADASSEVDPRDQPEMSAPEATLVVQLPTEQGAGSWDFANASESSDGDDDDADGDDGSGEAPQPFASAGAQWGEWLAVYADDYDTVADSCQDPSVEPLSVVSSELILPVACGVAPSTASLDLLRISLALPVATPAVAAAPAPAPVSSSAAATTETTSEASASDAESAAEEGVTELAAEDAPVAAAAPASVGDFSAAVAGVSAKALNLAAPSDSDGWLTPRGGYCISRQLPNNDRSITALAFTPDGKLFIAFDSKLTGEVDPLILNDAFHPSRSIAVYDPSNGNQPEIILNESSRVTGMDYDNGILWISRAGEVGMIPDGGSYETLAGGFAVDSHLFHANNGIVVAGGYVYVSAGGVRDGYYEGPIMGISEQGAQDIVSGGNPWAARIVRAPIGDLLSTRSITAFTTAARGVRNPYGITVDPAGRIWWTDNGATNVPEGVRAGDEVDMLNPSSIGGGEMGAPYYGFPLAIMEPQPWFVPPVVNLVNTAAPTGITWAMGTIFFAQYGRDPGLYRLGESNGNVIAERVLLGWPILAVTTAPDGALWIGAGDGGLYRITGGCNN